MMRKKWNIILIAVLLMFTSVFLTACKTDNAAVNDEQTNSTEDVVSDEPIEYDADYAEDDEITNEDSSEEILDEHEEETVIDESSDIEIIQEKDSEY